MDWLHKMFIPWWRHDIEMLSTLLALWWENLQFCGAFNFVSVCLNKLLNKESWRSCGVTVQDHDINSMDWLHTNFHHMMASWHGTLSTLLALWVAESSVFWSFQLFLSACLNKLLNKDSRDVTLIKRHCTELWRHAHLASLYIIVTSRSSDVIVQHYDVTLIWRHCTERLTDSASSMELKKTRVTNVGAPSGLLWTSGRL